MNHLNHKLTPIILIIAFIITYNAQAQVKIGDNPSTIDANALLDLESTLKGFFLPRMTSIQSDVMLNPTNGIKIYNITTCMLIYDNGSSWKPLNNRQRENHLLVKSGSDLPDEESGVITLNSASIYEIIGINKLLPLPRQKL